MRAAPQLVSHTNDDFISVSTGTVRYVQCIRADNQTDENEIFNFYVHCSVF